jgi:hexosaminidase
LSETSNLAAEHPEIVNKLMIIGDSARSDLGDRIKNIKGKSVRKSGRRMQEHEIINHLAIDKSITIKNKAAYQYSGHGDKTLINGTLGSYDYADEEWLGFHGVDFEAIIDLEEEMTVEYIECGFLINQGSWIFSPQQVIISTSTDSIDFIVRNRFEINAGERNLTQEVERFKLAIAESSIRYVKISARNIATCPDWHDGAGSKSWLFIDEIIIR